MEERERDKEPISLNELDGVPEPLGRLRLDPSRVAGGEIVRVDDGFRVRGRAGCMHHHQRFLSGGFKGLFVRVVLIPAAI